jgi:Predicted AAA-ATPase/PD-(D/E)XK nuclease superfamily
MQKYPIGIQNFQKLREGGFVYVDKTQHIYNLTQQAGYYFLSRPRRFGKSLLISTLQALYEGRKALFDGLWIADKWNFEQTNPTIVIYFNQMSLLDVGLAKSLIHTLHNEAKRLGISLESDSVGFMFQELIQKLHAKTGRKVVVLIDEYDKPIVDYLDELETAEANRNILKSFYGILKPADEHLEFVLLTGVSKFSKVSIFSDLNNLNDISLDKKYASLIGITQTELEIVFSTELEALPIEIGITKESFLAQIKHWYNGYSWDKSTNRQPISVYNPFSLLNFFGKNGDFQNYWFTTGTPTWLIKLMRSKYIYDVESEQVTEMNLDTFDIHNLEITPILFQTGYLTIKSVDEDLYLLGYPNKEVKQSFLQYLLQGYRHGQLVEGLPMVVKIRKALEINDIETTIEIVNTVFSTLPYDLWQKENERFYHALIHLTFTLLGVYVQSEVHTSRGRCDVLVQTKDYIYAFEFKLDKTAQVALDQIEAKGYLNPYRSQTEKQLVAVGVNFSTELKAVESWLVKVG